METIGIIGGMGPMAGLDLHRKILEETAADRDQDHLNIVHVAYPASVEDRTTWLLEREGRNPGRGVLEMVNHLALLRVGVAGMPCNTAHAREIAGLVRFVIGQAKLKLRLLDMIEETAQAILARLSECRKVGLLATTGTVRLDVYGDTFSRHDLRVIVPDDAVQETVHGAIYHPGHGIKAGRVTAEARADLLAAAAHLVDRGAEAIVLGCTELPLAITEPGFAGVGFIDPTRVLARALIRETNPDKLRPWEAIPELAGTRGSD